MNWAWTAALTPTSPLFVLGAFVFGVLSSAGPCTITRVFYLVSQRSTLTRKSLLAFIAGNMAAFIALALGIVGLAKVADVMPYLYAAFAVISLWSGGVLLWQGAHDQCHTDAVVRPSRPFLEGIGFGLMLQPCCTPMILAFIPAAAVSPWIAVIALGAFTFGHVLPVFAVPFARRLLVHRDVLATVTATFAIVAGIYYGMLA